MASRIERLSEPYVDPRCGLLLFSPPLEKPTFEEIQRRRRVGKKIDTIAARLKGSGLSSEELIHTVRKEARERSSRALQ